MLATEVPVLFARACEVFIAELTTRAWIEATQNKRKTLSRSDIAAAAAQTETLDFLIDIVGREGVKPPPPGCARAKIETPLPEPRRSPIDMAAVAAEEQAAQDSPFLAMANDAGPLEWTFNSL